MADKVKFGKSGCSTIEVEPFTKICSFTKPDGSTALTFDVPTPAFVPVIPPNECACFTFTQTDDSKTVVVKDCDKQEQAKVEIVIEQQDADDCCTGRYKVTPKVEIPCMPFDVSEPTIHVTNRSGETAADKIDGSVELSVLKECCALKTSLDVTLPDCIKYHEEAPEHQISCCEKGVTVYRDLITIVEDKAHCSVYPRVNQIDIPCCTLADATLDDTTSASDPRRVKLDGMGSTVAWKLERKDCDIHLSLTSDIKCAPTYTDPPAAQVGICNKGTTEWKQLVKLEKDEETCTVYPVITPIELPCCTLADTTLNSGEIDIDGMGSKLKYELKREECDVHLSLIPDIKCVLPDPSSVPTNQVGVCNKGTTDWKQLVSFEKDETSCTLVPVITPIELPCCTLPDGTLTDSTVQIDSMGSTINYKLKRENCDVTLSLTPDIKCTLPTPSVSSQQIRVCNKGNTEYRKLVDIKKDAVSCTLYPVITPIELPCCTLADETTKSTFTLNGTAIECSLIRKDCGYRLEFNPNSITISIPSSCMPTIKTDDVTLTAKYNDSEGKEATTTVKMAVTSNGAACPTYSFSFGTLDLTGIGTSAITNGGDVFQGDSKKLYIDGDLNDSKDTWYGGGYGDLSTDSPTTTYSRGPKMGARYGSSYGSVPVDTSHAYYIIKTDKTQAQKWRSTRVSDERTDDKTSYDGVTGNLSLVMPAGVQWHERGIAMVLNHFMVSDAGVLSTLNETGAAVLVAPAPAVQISSSKETTTNASGLAITTDESSAVSNGLRIQYGQGFRIIKNKSADVDTGNKYRNKPSSENGTIALNHGKGLHIASTDSTPNSDKLELNKSAYDFKFYNSSYAGTTKYSIVEDAKLILNDDYEAANILGKNVASLEYAGYTNVNTWKRTIASDSTAGGEIIVPVVISAKLSTAETTTSLSTSTAFLRFTKNGLLVGADFTKSDATLKGNPPAEATYAAKRTGANNTTVFD